MAQSQLEPQSGDSAGAIARLIALYCQLLDDLRLEEWGELFTADALWSLPTVSFHGRAEIVKGVGAMEPPQPGNVKHVTFTPIIEFEDESHAYAWSDLMALMRSERGTWSVVAAGRYYDTLELSQGRWRFKRRICDIEWEGVRFDRAQLRPAPAR
jgi:3-phenylpropionate/cinnamic acid dioxygenase small subunit